MLHRLFPTSAASRREAHCIISGPNVAAEALTQRVVQNPSKGCVVHSECTAYGPEHLLVGVGQLRLYVKVGRSDGTKTAAT